MKESEPPAISPMKDLLIFPGVIFFVQPLLLGTASFVSFREEDGIPLLLLHVTIEGRPHSFARELRGYGLKITQPQRWDEGNGGGRTFKLQVPCYFFFRLLSALFSSTFVGQNGSFSDWHCLLADKSIWGIQPERLNY